MATVRMSKTLIDEILKNFGIDATRIFMISDSPPDRELEWTDEGIQSSKNLINRIERYFQNEKSSINQESKKKVEKFVKNIELMQSIQDTVFYLKMHIL